VGSDYNEESFFVRHAYKKLQRALKAEIDEDAWSTLYSTVSRPSEAPSTGRIAAKVINHYGDEVLKGVHVKYELGRLAMMSCASRPPASAPAGSRGPQNPGSAHRLPQSRG